MQMNTDPEWLKKMADEEDQQIINIGADAIQMNAKGIIAQHLAQAIRERDHFSEEVGLLQKLADCRRILLEHHTYGAEVAAWERDYRELERAEQRLREFYDKPRPER